MKRQEISLEIDIFDPLTLPMSRLAEYLKPFAAMLGSEANVHFVKVAEGSARCQAVIDPPATEKVRERAELVVGGRAPKAAMKAHAEIDELLAADNAIGHVFIGKEKVIEFPGRRRATQERIGPVRRDATIEGQIYSIGGKDETINVHLRDGDELYRCEVSVDLAKRLAANFLEGKVRLFGYGDWYRIDSKWCMSNFVATDYVPLDDKNLRDTVSSIRNIFSKVPDGQSLLTQMRELRHD